MDFLKHILDFEHDDNMRGGYLKHVIEEKFEEHDNFIVDLPKHILDMFKDDNFRGKE